MLIGSRNYEFDGEKFTIDGKTCFSICYGWDDGNAETGPMWGSAVDVVFANTAKEAKTLWEELIGQSAGLEGWSEPYYSSKQDIEDMERWLALTNEPLPFE